MISLLTISDFQTHPYKILVGKNMSEDKLSNEIEEKLGAAALQPIGKLYDDILQNGVSNRYLGPGENDTVENWQKIKALCESVLQYGRE